MVTLENNETLIERYGIDTASVLTSSIVTWIYAFAPIGQFSTSDMCWGVDQMTAMCHTAERLLEFRWPALAVIFLTQYYVIIYRWHLDSKAVFTSFGASFVLTASLFVVWSVFSQYFLYLLVPLSITAEVFTLIYVVGILAIPAVYINKTRGEKND